MKFLNTILTIFVLALVSMLALHNEAFAQVVAAVPPPTYLDGIISWFKNNWGMLTSAIAVLEVLLRLVPTQKALSVLVPLKYALDGLAYLATAISSLLVGMINSLNNASTPIKPLVK